MRGSIPFADMVADMVAGMVAGKVADMVVGIVVVDLQPKPFLCHS